MTPRSSAAPTTSPWLHYRNQVAWACWDSRACSRRGGRAGRRANGNLICLDLLLANARYAASRKYFFISAAIGSAFCASKSSPLGSVNSCPNPHSSRIGRSVGSVPTNEGLEIVEAVAGADAGEHQHQVI